MPATATHRICGGCTACCTVLDIEDADSPAGQRCQYEGANCCTIYPTRPQQCRDWQCQWMADNDHSPALLKDDERPDRIGLMFNIDIVPSYGPVLVCHELWDGAADESRETLLRVGSQCTVLLKRYKEAA